MSKNRGEVLTIALIAVIGTLLVTSSLPSLNIFGKLFGGSGSAKAPSEEVWKEQEQRTIPRVIGVTETGEKVIAFESVRTFKSGASKSAAKLTWGERVGNFFSGLTTWGLLFVVVSLVFFGGGPLVWVWKKYATMKSALKSTVAAIRETDDETYAKLKPKLDAKHDRRDRKVVDKIKMELQ